jgi:hypothetical protein
MGAPFDQELPCARPKSLDKGILCGHEDSEIFGRLPPHEAMDGQSSSERFDRAVKTTVPFHTELSAPVTPITKHKKFRVILDEPLLLRDQLGKYADSLHD